jgi:cell division protein FtsB
LQSEILNEGGKSPERARSSVAERSAHNRLVVGSIPTEPIFYKHFPGYFVCREVIMARKVLTGFFIALILLLSSCYPKLSVQQYDKLRQDIAALNTESEVLTGNVTALKAELASVRSDNAEALAYLNFMEKLISTQNSEKVLSGRGEFDVASLLAANKELIVMANDIKDSEIAYLLGIMIPNNDDQTITAYYKIIEKCIKKIKQDLHSQ